MAGTVLVTGGTGGLGVAVTRRFLDSGWRTVVPWYDPSELDRLERHEKLELVEADLFDTGSVASCVRAAAGDAGHPLRAVVNLVGGFHAGGRVHEEPIDALEDQLRINVRAGYLTCQAALPHLMDAGGGSVVCVSSKVAQQPFPGGAAYATAKAAVLGLVDSLAVEYGKDGIRVNAILPTMIDTPGNRAAMPDADRSNWTPPADIAGVVHFLCGDEATTINGAHIGV